MRRYRCEPKRARKQQVVVCDTVVTRNSLGNVLGKLSLAGFNLLSPDWGWSMGSVLRLASGLKQ